MLVPMDVHADQTELMQMLNKGHHNVELDSVSITKLACWIDSMLLSTDARSDIKYLQTDGKKAVNCVRCIVKCLKRQTIKTWSGYL